MDIRSLLRPHLLDLVPYSSARDEFKGTANVFLDANENALGSTSDSRYRRYPDPYQVELKKKIGEMKDLNPDMIFLGNGSDEPIDLLLRAFCNPGTDRIIITPPTYGMYEVSANINDVGIVRVPLNRDDFSINTEQILQNIEPGVKIIFLCSPNNPTGNSIEKRAILEILEKFQGLVVLDEAYIDFSPNESMIHELKNNRRLIILQTFSKAWGLAALRLGVLYGDQEIISILNMIKPPYNIGQATQELALDALSQQDRMQTMVNNILKNKQHLESSLSEIASVRKVYPSDANFFLVKIDDEHEVYLKLIDSKVIVRDRSKVELCEDCLRITVGTEAENNQLTEELKKICS